MLTAAQLSAFAPRCDAETLAPILDAELSRGGVNTSLRVCHFLAQVSAETAGLTVFAENLNYSAERLLRVFPRHFDAETAAAYAHQPECIANRVYANRMGNGDEASGDGWRYRGRGELEITGRENYARAAVETGLDLVAHPELLEDPAHGIEAAVDYWTDRHLNAEADLDDIVAITEAINGGLNGLDQRKLAFTSARAIWTDEVIAPKAAPVAATPPPVAAATAGAVVVPDTPQAAPAPPPAAAPRPVTDLDALVALIGIAAGLIAAAAVWLLALIRRPKRATPKPAPRASGAETPVPRDPQSGAANMDFIQTVEADAAKALAEVKAGLTYLEHEGAAIIAWVEKDVPGAAGAIATFLQGAEGAAADLAKYAANGLSTEISAGGDAMQTWLLNLIQASGFSTNAQNGLKAIDASAVALIESIGQKLVSTALVSLLAKLAPAVAAAV